MEKISSFNMLSRHVISIFCLFLYSGNGMYAQRISDNPQNDICIVTTVRDLRTNVLLNNYVLIIDSNGVSKTLDVINETTICILLSEGVTYKFKIKKDGFTSPEYEWTYNNHQNDHRILNFNIYPLAISEKEKKKLKKQRKKEKKKAEKEVSKTCGIEGWYTFEIE